MLGDGKINLQEPEQNEGGKISGPGTNGRGRPGKPAEEIYLQRQLERVADQEQEDTYKEWNREPIVVDRSRDVPVQEVMKCARYPTKEARKARHRSTRGRQRDPGAGTHRIDQREHNQAGRENDEVPQAPLSGRRRQSEHWVYIYVEDGGAGGGGEGGSHEGGAGGSGDVGGGDSTTGGGSCVPCDSCTGGIGGSSVG